MPSANFTVQKVCDLARMNLRDPNKGRWKDVALLAKFNQAMQEFRALRPDFFVGLTASLTQADLTTPFPLDDIAVPDFVNVLTAAMFEIDDEYAASQQPERFRQRFARQQ